MDIETLKLVLALLIPKIPLITRVTISHILQLTESAKYLDLRSELTVSVLRAYLQPTKPRTISGTQGLVNRDPGVKGQIWVATYASPVPPETGVKDALAAAMEGLANKSAPASGLKLPELTPVEAEWTGYRAAADPESRPPLISEKEKFDELQKECKTPTTILYLHGGAYYICDPSTHRPVTKKLAELTGGRCYSVRYRLAPQHPFPAALLDALVSYLTLLYPPPDAYHDPVRPEHIVISGDSAGGNLSLALLQTILELRRQNRTIAWFGEERDVPLPAGVAVNSPWMDITQSMPSWDRNGQFDYLPPASVFQKLVVPPCDVWPASPPRKSLYVDDTLIAHPLATLTMNKSWEGSPPVFICTGWEMLADEDKFTASKLASDGVTVVFEEYEAMPHCFAMILTKTPNSKRCFAGWAGFIRAATANPGSIVSKAVTVKAKTLEELDLDFASLSDLTEEEVRDRVRAKVAADLGIGSRI